jgi:TrmH family RNA methyltransferase
VEITSVNNDLVKEVVKLQQKKYRDKTGKFLLEGRKCVEEAISAGLEFECIFVDKHLLEVWRAGCMEVWQFNESSLSKTLQAQQTDNSHTSIPPYLYTSNKIISTTPSVLKKISTTDTPPDIVAAAYKKTFEMPKNAKKVVLLENIKDLGNLGTILRTSVAFGADAVILYGKDCADIYNPKCVRSTVGNLWKIPVIYIEDFTELKNMFKDFERVATLPRAKEYLKDFKVKEPVLVMFGSEADGLSDELINFSTKSVKIEMSKNVESLNLSVSCAVVLYKFL